MSATFSKSFLKRFSARIDRWSFEVGILNDREHKAAVPTPFGEEPQLKTYAGGPARRISRESSGMTIAEIFVKNQERLNIDLLRAPFQNPQTEIMRFTKEFLRMATGAKIPVRRVENLLQAVVRNPILRQQYGENTSRTADAKGFDRHLIDTAQTFKSIIARAKRV